MSTGDKTSPKYAGPEGATACTTRTTPSTREHPVTSFSRVKFSKTALKDSFIFLFSSSDSSSNFFVILCSAEERAKQV